MNIVIISGSMRSQSQSLKVSNWLVDHARSLHVEPELIDLHGQTLPLYDDGETEAPNAKEILETLDRADAAVFVSPEWNGMMSHGLVNLMHYIGKELAHKPVMLVGVTSGRNGHYPLMQMRVMGYKNNQFVISPENLLVQGVKDIMNSHEPEAGSSDESVQTRADYALRVLIEYGNALRLVRESGVVNFDQFPNGV